MFYRLAECSARRLSFPHLHIGIENDTQHNKGMPTATTGIENDTWLIGSIGNLMRLGRIVHH